MYNNKSAQHCLIKLLTLYPNVYPPSNFIKIPKTHKRGSIRAFIKDPRKKYLVGYINKFGKPFRLRRPIITKKKVPIVIDHHNVLHKIITNKNCINENLQKVIEKQIKAKDKLIKHAQTKYANVRIKNPETGNDIKITSALGYGKDHPVFKAAVARMQQDKKAGNKTNIF